MNGTSPAAWAEFSEYPAPGGPSLDGPGWNHAAEKLKGLIWFDPA
jgi:hypothetical protein